MLYPMFAVVLLTFVVGAVTMYHRFAAVLRGKVSIKYFRTMSGEAVLPETMAKASRHFDNLFEVPTLFYVACLAAMFTGKTGEAIQVTAWVFVFARVLHAFIHLTYNNVVHRMLSFQLGFAAMLVMWFMLVV